MQNKLNIITIVSNKNHHGLIHLLQPSTAIFNLNLIVLETAPDAYNSHRCKDSLLYQYLQIVPEEKIILFTDGYDTLFVCTEEEILTKYQKIDKQIVFSAEINCWPDKRLAEKYPETKSQYRYLCSGGFLGRAGYIKRKIEENLHTDSISKYPKSNQGYWSEQFLRDQQNIALDSQCEIFQAFSSEIDMYFIQQPENDENFNKYLEQKVNWFNKNFSIRNNRIYNKATNTTPCHIHTNGLSKLIAAEIANMIGLNTDIVSVNK